MLAFIALFFPAALMVIWKRKLFDEEYDWKIMALEYVINVLLLNFIAIGIACFIFGSTGSVVSNLNTYSAFALKYIFLSSLLAVALPWIYLKTDKFGFLCNALKRATSHKSEKIDPYKQTTLKPIERSDDLKGSVLFGVILLFGIGILLRFAAMSCGHNYDFESYCIVGEIVTKFENVYALTTRYNYAFIFSMIQGICYKLGWIFSEDPTTTFRVLIVSILTITDIGISFWIWNRYSLTKALIFFLNPISIVVTGYHNQFDNIAVLMMLLSVSFFDESAEVTKRDILSIAFMCISLLTKHLFFVFPIWILFKYTMNFKKKLLYSFVPPAVFLFSFIPFAINNSAAIENIINRVFLYRSYNNIPLLSPVLSLMQNSGISILTSLSDIIYQGYFWAFAAILVLLGFLYRKEDFEHLVLYYLIALVAFSSAIANQYLIIPLVALVIIDKGRPFMFIYTFLGTIYCILNKNELHLSSKFIKHLPKLEGIISKLGEEGGLMVSMMAIVLAIFIVKLTIDVIRKEKC